MHAPAGAKGKDIQGNPCQLMKISLLKKIFSSPKHEDKLLYFYAMSRFTPKWRWIKNKFVFTALLFLLWMTFIDNNDFFRHAGLLKRLHAVKAELKAKQELIDDTKRQLKELRNKKTLEKFAREEYLFKKPGEEVFVIVSKQSN
jgi:cell division protein DivIC